MLDAKCYIKSDSTYSKYPEKADYLYCIIYKDWSISWLPEADIGLKNNYKCTQENFLSDGDI